MIKWDGFGKLLKLSFFGLLISCFTLSVGSSVKGYRVQQVGLQSMPSTEDSNYEITFLKGGGLLTNYLGQSKGFVAFDNSSFFWWAPNGIPYFYDTNSIQGYFQEFWSCPEITGLDYSFNINNCSSQLITGDYVDLFKGFFSKVDNSDYVYYSFTPYYYHGSSYGSSVGNFITVCFSSDDIHSSLCFLRRYCYDSVAGGCQENYGHLTGSLNYNNLSFSSMSYNSYGPAPGQVGYAGIYEGSSEGSTTGNYNNTITGDYTYSTCTNGQILSYAESVGFSRYLCYGGLSNFDLYDSSVNYNAIPGTGKSLGQILSYSSAWDSPNDWFNFWNGLYGDSKYNDMWSSYPAVYHTWFDFYHQYGGEDFDFDTIRELCIMYDLDLDINGTYNGTKFRNTCQFISQGGWDNYGGGYGVGSGQYPQGVNWNGVGNSSNNSPSDGISFIQNFFNLTKSNVATDYSGGAVGFLPKYIIIFFLAVLLFKFLKH